MNTSLPVSPLDGTTKTTTPEQAKPKRRWILKIGIIISLLLIFFLFLTFLAGTAYAWQSNKNVFFFSDVVEKTENLIMNNEKFIDSKNPFSSILAPLSSLAGNEDSLTSFFQADVTGQDIEELFGNSDEITSYKYEYNFVIDTKIDDSSSTTEEITEYINPNGTLSVNLKGASSNNDSDSKTETDIKGSYKAEGTTFEAEASIKSIDSKLYVYLKTIPTLGIFDLSEFKNKWWMYDLKDYQQMMEESETEPTEEDKLSKEELDKIAEILNSDVIINNITRKPDEVIGDIRTYCMELNLDKDEVKEVLEKINNAIEEEENRLTAEDIDEIHKAVEYVKFGWCMGRRDMHLYKLYMDSEIKNEGYDVKAHFDGTMWDYNVPVSIEAPSDSEDLQKYIEDIINSYQDDYNYDYNLDEDYNFDEYDYNYDEEDYYQYDYGDDGIDL